MSMQREVTIIGNRRDEHVTTLAAIAEHLLEEIPQAVVTVIAHGPATPLLLCRPDRRPWWWRSKAIVTLIPLQGDLVEMLGNPDRHAVIELARPDSLNELSDHLLSWWGVR
jgi:hypothetical protein